MNSPLHLLIALICLHECLAPAASPDRDLIDAGSKAKAIFLCSLTKAGREARGEGIGKTFFLGAVFKIKRKFKGNDMPEQICTDYHRRSWPPYKAESVLRVGDELILFGYMDSFAPVGGANFHIDKILDATPENISKISSLVDVFSSKDPWNFTALPNDDHPKMTLVPRLVSQPTGHQSSNGLSSYFAYTFAAILLVVFVLFRLRRGSQH